MADAVSCEVGIFRDGDLGCEGRPHDDGCGPKVATVRGAGYFGPAIDCAFAQEYRWAAAQLRSRS